MHFGCDLETTSFPVYFLNKTLDYLVSFYNERHYVVEVECLDIRSQNSSVTDITSRNLLR